MVKNDLKMLFTACLIAITVAGANFESLSENFDPVRAGLENFKQSETYKSYAALKNSEANFWADVKGTKSAGGEISQVLDETPVEQTPPPPTSEKISVPAKFLLIGDSMMLVGFGPALENSLLKFEGVGVVRRGVYSTGLNRIDYYDWYGATDKLIAEHKPDVLIIMFGGNDGQGIADKNGKNYDFGTDEWQEVYRRRVDVYLNRFAPQVKKIYWVGQPMTGNESFFNKFQIMNAIYRSETAKFPSAVYVDTWERFAVNGVYRQSIPDDNGLWQIAKQSDGVHVTDFGGGILAGLVLKEVGKDVELK